jgi:protein-L-isoaspartate(D-aspartate) O-methyltransferase
MNLEYILPEEDYGLYKRNITLLEEQVIHHFPEFHMAPEILAAIRSVPRHLFVNRSYRYMAYTDNAIPTSGGFTTSAPSVIAEMIYSVGIKRGEKLLEIGTGTGYEAAILGELGVHVFTIELDKHLALEANRILTLLGYKVEKNMSDQHRGEASLARYREMRKLFPYRGKVRLFLGNGQCGLEKCSPYKGIIVAASVPHLRYVDELPSQLSDAGGRMVVPVGRRNEQSLCIVERREGRLPISRLRGVTFDFIRLYRDSN